MEKLINSFGDLVKIVQSNVRGALIAFVMIVILAVVGFGVTQTNQIVKHFPTSNQEQARFGDAQDVEKRVNYIIRVALVDAKADRVSVGAFHNSQMDLVGIPFVWYSTRFYDTAPGIAYDASIFNQVPTSLLNELTTKVWADIRKPTCVKMYTDELSNQAYKSRIALQGVKFWYSCPLLTNGGAAFGLVSLSYMTEKDGPEDDFILSELQDSASKISTLLTSTREPPKKFFFF